MSEVSEALDHAMLETGIAVITPEMVMRDAWAAHEAHRSSGMSIEPRATPARAYRLRLCTSAVEGPHWLTLLAQCAYLRGVIAVEDTRTGS